MSPLWPVTWLCVSFCLCVCVSQDGSMFKARVPHAPYFYLQIKVGPLTCTHSIHGSNDTQQQQQQHFCCVWGRRGVQDGAGARSRVKQGSAQAK